MPTSSPNAENRLLTAVAGYGSLDSVSRTLPAEERFESAFARTDTIMVCGWATARKPTTLLDSVDVIIDGIAYRAQYGVERHDAARALVDDALTPCGFALALPASRLDVGMHSLTIRGSRGDARFRLRDETTFAVIAPVADVTQLARIVERPARIRALRDTRTSERHDARSAAAVRCGAALVVEGWALAGDGAIPETIDVVLVGRSRSYRASSKRKAEYEAGMAIGFTAIASGFEAYVDTGPMQPGLYELALETRTGSGVTALMTGRAVEVMAEHYEWLPRALPTYVTGIDSRLDAPLPISLVHRSSFTVSGVARGAAVAGAFIRFDRDVSYALTLEAGDAADGGGPDRRFGGLLQPPLSIGRHAVDILLLDERCAGCWLVESATIDILPIRRLGANGLASPSH